MKAVAAISRDLVCGCGRTERARGRETIETKVVFGILRGWVIGPAAGAALGFILADLTRLF